MTPLLPDTTGRRCELAARMLAVRLDVRRVQEISAVGALMLKELAQQTDQAKVNAAIAEVRKITREAETLTPAFGLVQRLNQTGALKRAKADRALAVDTDLTPVEVQRRQLQRDVANLAWTYQAAATLVLMLDAAIMDL